MALASTATVSLLSGCSRSGNGSLPSASGSSAPGAHRQPDPGAPLSDALGAPSSDGHRQQCVVTPDNIEGPYYRPGAPEQWDMVSHRVTGSLLDIRGVVSGVDCRPIQDAQIEIWQADAKGAYDLKGHQLRCQMRSNAEGGYQVATIEPGQYLNGKQYRPAHVHFKVTAPGYRPLTTQLYFEGDPYNSVDPFIDEGLIRPYQLSGGRRLVSFDIVLPTA